MCLLSNLCLCAQRTQVIGGSASTDGYYTTYGYDLTSWYYNSNGSQVTWAHWGTNSATSWTYQQAPGTSMHGEVVYWKVRTQQGQASASTVTYGPWSEVYQLTLIQ